MSYNDLLFVNNITITMVIPLNVNIVYSQLVTDSLRNLTRIHPGMATGRIHPVKCKFIQQPFCRGQKNGADDLEDRPRHSAVYKLVYA